MFALMELIIDRKWTEDWGALKVSKTDVCVITNCFKCSAVKKREPTARIIGGTNLYWAVRQ